MKQARRIDLNCIKWLAQCSAYNLQSFLTLQGHNGGSGGKQPPVSPKESKFINGLWMPDSPHEGCSLGPQALSLSFGLLHHRPFSTHLQSKVDGSEQAFANWAGEVPPPKGFLELGHYATESGEKALCGKRVSPRRSPEDEGIEQGQRQRHPQEPQAGGSEGSVPSLVPGGPGVAPAGIYSVARHCLAS